jgi:TRAP-type C4-dicarboxylate transport system substrate-binding protein
MKKRTVFVTIWMMSLVFISTPTAALDQKIEIKLPIATNTNFPEGVFYQRFIEKVKTKSGDKIIITPYWNAQLGREKEIYEAVSGGLYKMTSGAYANISHITTAFEVLHLPFLFSCIDQNMKALFSPAVKDQLINPELSKRNLKWIFSLPFSPRQLFTTNFKVEKPSDLADKKMRCAGSPFECSMQNAFGAKAVSIPWSETIQSLNTGMIDGFAVPADAAWSAKLYNQIKYVGILNCMGHGHTGFVNLKWWESQPQEFRDIIMAAAGECENEWEEYYIDVVNEKVAKAIEKGVTYYGYSKEAHQEFVKLGKSVWQKFTDVAPPEKIQFIQDHMGPDTGRGFGVKF